MLSLEKENTILNGIDLDQPTNSGAIEVVSEQEFTNFMSNHKKELAKDPAVKELMGKINVTEPKSIIAFGEESSLAITNISNQLLGSMKAVKEEEAGELLTQLTNIMKKVDLDEVKNGDAQKGIISKIFSKAKKSIEDLLSKYDNIGLEVEGVYVTLKRYEAEIIKETDNLSQLYKANIQYFRELEKYIVAGEMAVNELEYRIIPEYQQKAETSSDPLALTNVETLKNCKDMVEQRVYDLKLAENVALQSLPMIQQMQRGNFELMKTINSSFIITLPIFKQCLVQAIMLKRQENRAKNIKELQSFTNDLLVRNATNASKQAVALAKMNGAGIIDLNKLEESFNIIQNGIREAKKQQEDNKKLRIDGGKKLERMKYKTLSNREISLGGEVNNLNNASIADCISNSDMFN